VARGPSLTVAVWLDLTRLNGLAIQVRDREDSTVATNVLNVSRLFDIQANEAVKLRLIRERPLIQLL
jgi:hypothetical protein